MRYLLIEEKAWFDMQATAKHSNERMQMLERYYFPAKDSG
jgi:hypothetical protein